MAEQTYKIKLVWENDKHFKMTTQKNSGSAVTDVKIEENAHIDQIWSPIQSACMVRLNQILTDIGKEMCQ